MFACWQTYGYFNIVSNKSQQKMTKILLFCHGENMPILGFMGNLSDYLVKNH